MFLYDTPVARLEDLTTRIVVASVRTTSTHPTILHHPSSVGVGCAMTYAAVTLNNSCEKITCLCISDIEL
ncbi:hypothetical protein TNCV_2497061 [Trichonephila clavipes]|nr:hypothetical protein TNCV_2497061 [Trichonephila clavipes]